MSAEAIIRPGLPRLTGVELRKMLDTRAGLWLQIVVGLLTLAAVVVVVIAGNDEDRTFHELMHVAIQPAVLLLPIVGILLVTSEWTQRTALITFALVPRRGRVLVAKLSSAVLLSVVVTVLCLALATLATAVGGGDDPDTWTIRPVLLLQDLLYLLIAMVTGVAFGAVARASAPAIVAYFALPIAFAALFAIPALKGAGRWLDSTQTVDRLVEGTLSATQWAQAGVSLLLWMVVPLVLGTWLLLRSEVRA